MKNLKKVLSLVLALAMALSLMTAAFAADASDYKDYSKVTYKEAVDVMTAAGIFNGGDGNNFNPDATLNREQAAKIITYMLMGQKEADKLTTTIAPYADVAANRWSAGSIAYCTNEGIIAGDGNGRFNPTAGVTGLQFAKMLLVALGYDAEIEKLVGNSWAINTAKLALNTDLDEDMEDISLSKELTREEAAQMAFNTMKANIVEYDSQTDINVNGAQVVIGNKKAYNVTTSRDWGKNIYDDEAKDGGNGYIVQFAEQYCRDLELNETATTADSFGRPAHKWSYDNDKVGTYADKAVLTYTTEFKGTELADDIDDAGCEFAKKDGKYNDVTIVRNGGEANTMKDAEISALLDSSKAISGTGNGVAIEFYANDKDEVTTVVVVATYLGEVKSIKKDKDSTKADERELRVEYKDTGAATHSLTLTDDDTKGFNDVYDNVKVGDKVLVTPKGDNSKSDTAVSVAIPETVEAAITKVNNKDKELTAGGEVYGIAKTSTTTYAADTDDVTLYLDQYGYVMDATDQSDSKDKAVAVLKVYQTLNKDGELTDMIRGVTSDGETVNWEYEGTKPDADKVYTYTEDDGVYTLTEATATTVAKNGTVKIASSNEIKTSTKRLTIDSKTVYFDSSVKFIFVDEGKATVLDGVQKVAQGTTAYATIKEEDGTFYITALYVMDKASSSSSTSDDLVFVASASTGTVSVIVDGEKETYHSYEAYVKGEEVDFYTESSNAQPGFYSVEIDDASGAYILKGNEYTTQNGSDLDVTGEAEVKGVAGNILSTNGLGVDAGAATIVDVTDNDLDTLSAIKDALEENTVKIRMIYNGETNEADYIYVVSCESK